MSRKKYLWLSERNFRSLWGDLARKDGLFLYLLTMIALFGTMTDLSAFEPFGIKMIPIEAGAIQNAGSGTEIWRGGPSNGYEFLVKDAVRVSPYSVNSMIRTQWYVYEKEKGVYDFSSMDQSFKYGIQYGQKLNLAVFTTSTNAGLKIDGALCAYPLYLHEAMQKSDKQDVKYTSNLGNVTRWEPNFENPYFFERYDKLLEAFAEYLERPIDFNGKTVVRKKLVRCIELRHFGWWGEGGYPKQFVPGDSKYLIQFAESYLKHFPDIRLIAPTNGMGYFPNTYGTIADYHFFLMNAKNNAGLFGIFRDNFGWDEDWNFYQAIYYASNKWEKNGVKLYELIRDRWKFAPLVGEPGQTYPKKNWRPYSTLIRQAEYLHPAVVRNCNVSLGKGRSATNPTDYTVLKDPQAIAEFHRFYSIIGFRYVIDGPNAELDGDRLTVSLGWFNIGLTPTYDRWKIQYIIRDQSGKDLWTGSSAFDLRSLLPEETIKPGQFDRTKVKAVSDVFKLDADVLSSVVSKELTGSLDVKKKMACGLFVKIVDPDGISPPMALSIEGRTKDGAYQIGRFF